MEYWKIFTEAIVNHFNYVVREVTQPGWINYFYFLIILSLLVWSLEIIVPWRKNQKVFRKQFFLDVFYMFFNFFIFMIFFQGIAKVSEQIILNFLQFLGSDIAHLHVVNLQKLPIPLQLVIFFIVADFVQWWTHRLLHRVDFLWQFHKVHHSVEEMGFAAHLRYHWMETVVYKSIQFLPLAILGNVNTHLVFIVFYFQIIIGHLNHANIRLDYGPLKYILNNPAMHIWHHAKNLPTKRSYGVNFGLSLSIWDYLFGTAYIPSSGRDIPLGFNKVESFPQRFLGQMIYPFTKHKN